MSWLENIVAGDTVIVVGSSYTGGKINTGTGVRRINKGFRVIKTIRADNGSARADLIARGLLNSPEIRADLVRKGMLPPEQQVA